MRSLGREAVELEGRQQADDGVWSARRDRDQRVMLGDPGPGQAVEAAVNALQRATLGQTT